MQFTEEEWHKNSRHFDESFFDGTHVEGIAMHGSS